MNNLRIAPKNFWDLMTVSGSIAPASGFAYANTQNAQRSSVWRSPDATAQYVRGSLASGSVNLNSVWLFRHHCHGGTVQFRAWSNNDWTGTLLVDTGAVATYTPIASGDDYGYVANASLDTHDPDGLSSHFVSFFTPVTGVKSVQLDFASKATTYGYAYWEVGRIFVGQYVEQTANPSYDGYGLGRWDQSLRVRSRGGSLVGAQGAGGALLKFNRDVMTENEIETWLRIMRDNGTVGDVALSVFPGVGGFQERNAIINGTLAQVDVIGRAVVGGFASIVIEGN